MDARKSRPKGRQIREVKTKQMEGQDLESVIERAQASALNRELQRFDTVPQMAAAGGWQPMHRHFAAPPA